jgi:hypothetical protein
MQRISHKKSLCVLLWPALVRVAANQRVCRLFPACLPAPVPTCYSPACYSPVNRWPACLMAECADMCRHVPPIFPKRAAPSPAPASSACLPPPQPPAPPPQTPGATNPSRQPCNPFARSPAPPTGEQPHRGRPRHRSRWRHEAYLQPTISQKILQKIF